MLIPDDNHKYALVEAAKQNGETKQFVEDGGRQCPEMMSKMFNGFLEVCTNRERDIKLYSFLLSSWVYPFGAIRLI